MLNVQSVRSAIVLGLCFVLTEMTACAVASPPNILVIFTDDHGYADLSCQQVLPDVRTPHLDALAAAGVRMTDGYVTAPQCVPSRTGLLSGQYQNRLGVESNVQFQEEGGMDGFNAADTIAERLQQAGYTTGMAGKWHVGPGNRVGDHGFDRFFYKNSNRPGVANFDLDGNDVPLGQEKTGMYHLDACAAAACTFIERYRSQPFFFYLALRAPHVPLDAPKKYLACFPGEMPERRRQALAMLSAVDDGVGRIIDTLRTHQLEENTLIFFISDNGAPLKIHKRDAPGGGPGWDGSLNDPLNGEKGMLTEGGIRTPYLVQWKGTIPAGLVYSHPVISLDVAATAVACAGLPHDPVLDGVNLIPHLTGRNSNPPHEALYWRWNGQAAIRKGPWKYLTAGGRAYLFNLTSDAEERHNLIAQHTDLAVELRQDWDAWADTLEPPGLPPRVSQSAEAYFDWYLDGKRNKPDVEPEGRRKRSPSLSNSELFKRRDTDGDGKVTLSEFLNGRTGDVVQVLTKRFKKFDTNSNGSWDAAEVTP